MKYLVLFIFGFLSNLVWSGEGSWSYRMDLEDVITGVSYKIADRTFNGQDAMDYEAYEGLVFLEYTRKNQSDLTQLYDWEIRVTYAVNGLLQADPLVISSMASNYTYADYAKILSVDPVTGYDVKIIDIEGDWYDSQGVMTTVSDPEDDVHFPDDIDLRLELRSERWFDLDVETATAELLEMSFDAATYRADWSYIEGAELYDFEWVWIDEKSVEADDIATTSGNYAYKRPFELKEPVRVRLWKTHHLLDQTYETGTIYFRVRPVSQWVENGTVYEDIKEGEWTYFTLPDNFDPTVGSYILSTVVSHTITTGHENDKNWLFSTIYAENGKSTSAITYHDGSNRGRQNLSYNTSDDVTLVGESFYDNEGRQTVSVIPAPIPGRQMSYQQDFNLVGSGDVFDEQDIDHQYYLTNLTPALSNLSGAAQYFSIANSFTDDLFRDGIPAANGYVYNQTVYRNDGSGRIERVGGIGEEFQVSGDHAVRTFYMSPTHFELKRLFGSNVPNDLNGYRKEMVRDANGQYSVTYYDKRGNVIATGLAGNAPDNLIELEDANTVTAVTSLLSNNTQIGDYAMVSEHTYVPTFENASITLDYNLNGLVNTIAGQTTTINGHQVTFGDMCATCEYILEIEVVDQNGNPVYPVVGGSPTNGHYYDSIDATGNCFDQNGAIITPPTGVSHATGGLIYNLSDVQEYRIIKTLTVNTESMTENFETQLANAPWNNLANFIAEYTSVLDFSDCFTNCNDYCLWSLKYEYEVANGPNTWDNHWNSLTTQQQINAIAACTAIECDLNDIYSNFDPETMGTNPTINPWEQSCEAQLNLMIQQIMPGHIFYDDQSSWLWTQFSGSSVILPVTGEHDIVDLQDPTYITEEIARELIVEGYHRESCHYLECIESAGSMSYSSSLGVVFDPNIANSSFGSPSSNYSDPWTTPTAVGSLDPFVNHPANTADLSTISGVSNLDGAFNNYDNIEYAVYNFDEYNQAAINALTTQGCAGVSGITTLQDYVDVLVDCMEAEDILENGANAQSTAFYDDVKIQLFRSLYDQIKFEIARPK